MSEYQECIADQNKYNGEESQTFSEEDYTIFF